MNEGKLINDAGLAIIKRFEGLRLKAYLDVAGVPTIGYGHTRMVTTQDVVRGRTCSLEDAYAWLKQDCGIAERDIARMVRVSLNDNQFSALVSWVYNVGGGAARTSRLILKLNRGDYASVPLELLRWKYAKGRVLEGLYQRRVAEGALWQSTTLGAAGRGLPLNRTPRAEVGPLQGLRVIAPK